MSDLKLDISGLQGGLPPNGLQPTEVVLDEFPPELANMKDALRRVKDERIRQLITVKPRLAYTWTMSAISNNNEFWLTYILLDWFECVESRGPGIDCISWEPRVRFQHYHSSFEVAKQAVIEQCRQDERIHQSTNLIEPLSVCQLPRDTNLPAVNEISKTIAAHRVAIREGRAWRAWRLDSDSDVNVTTCDVWKEEL